MNTNANECTALTLGEKIRESRKQAGYTQEELAAYIGVSRQAITKWESDRGLPDIENIKLLAKSLKVSIDYLLNDDKELDMTVLRRPICLKDYTYKPAFSGRWIKKAGIKDTIVKENFPDANIYMLIAQQINTKSETVIDHLLVLLFNAPFGIPEIINGFKNADKEFYLVDQKEKQFLVTVTDEFIESRQLSSKITNKKFTLGQFKFINCGLLK